MTASRVGFTGLNHVGGLQILSDDANISDDRASSEMVLTELSEDNNNKLSDPSKIFLKNIGKNIGKHTSTNTMSSIGFTDGLSTNARSTESYIKPRRVLVNE